MSHPTSVAERLDLAVDGILDGLSAPIAAAAAGIDPATRPLVELASDLRAALLPPPPGIGFEERLAARLASPRTPLAWVLRHPGRLIVTGAVGSAAVGVGMTAFAVWRGGRRTGGLTHRFLPR